MALIMSRDRVMRKSSLLIWDSSLLHGNFVFTPFLSEFLNYSSFYAFDVQVDFLWHIVSSSYLFISPFLIRLKHVSCFSKETKVKTFGKSNA